VAAGLDPLGHHGVGPGCLRRQRLGQGGGAGEPGDPPGVQRVHEGRREQAHDAGHDRRASLQQRGALRVEILGRGVRGLQRHRRPPVAEEAADAGLQRRVAPGWRVGNPKVDLERPVASAAEPGGPVPDPGGVGQQRAHRAHAAGVGHCSGQLHRAGARHRRGQDRDSQAEPAAEGFGAVAGGRHRWDLSSCPAWNAVGAGHGANLLKGCAGSRWNRVPRIMENPLRAPPGSDTTQQRPK
jgi:hypothetical protein